MTLASDLGRGWSLFRLSTGNRMCVVEFPPEGVAPGSPEFTACAAAQVWAITFRNLLKCGLSALSSAAPPYSRAVLTYFYADEGLSGRGCRPHAQHSDGQVGRVSRCAIDIDIEVVLPVSHPYLAIALARVLGRSPSTLQ